MLKREIDSTIDATYNNGKMALMLTGARQVGKTNAFRRLAQRKFEHYLEINFLETPSAKRIFDGVENAKEMLLRISAFADTPLVPGKTFILFDDVQKCPECITKIKFLVDEGSFRYGLTGSLLGVELKDMKAKAEQMNKDADMPVGYMDIKEMFPLDFEEFAEAVGVSHNVWAYIRECFEEKKTVDAVVHERMMAVYRLYMMVGGMPEPVMQYLKSNNMQLVGQEQLAILNLYKQDISQYDTGNRMLWLKNCIPKDLRTSTTLTARSRARWIS